MGTTERASILDLIRTSSEEEVANRLAGDPVLLESARRLADEALERAASPPFDRDEHDFEPTVDPDPVPDPLRFAMIFWRMGSAHEGIAREYQERLFRLPLPVWPRNPVDCARAAERHFDRIFISWACVPVGGRGGLAPAWAEAIGAVRASAKEHAVVQRLLVEWDSGVRAAPFEDRGRS